MVNIPKKSLNQVLLGVNVLYSAKKNPAETLHFCCYSGADVSNSCMWCWCGRVAKLIHNQTVPPSVEQERKKNNIHPATLFWSDRWYVQNNLVLRQLSLGVWQHFKVTAAWTTMLNGVLYCCCLAVGSCCGFDMLHNASRSNGFKVMWSTIIIKSCVQFWRDSSRLSLTVVL